MIESFESYIETDLKKDILASKDEKKNIKGFKAFIEYFEDSNCLNEYENLLKKLDGLKTATPLFHFLICKSCKNLKLLRNAFPDHKINFFRFVKGEQVDYEIVKAIDPIHKEPKMVAFIIETDVINKLTSWITAKKCTIASENDNMINEHEKQEKQRISLSGSTIYCLNQDQLESLLKKLEKTAS